MDTRQLSEVAAKRVLARAIELDEQRGVVFSVNELRDIAAEVGVSITAFDRALREVEAPTVGMAPLKRRLLNVGVAGAAIGGVTGLIDSATYFVSSPITMGVTLMVAAGVGVLESFRSPGRGFVRYSSLAAGLWLGYAAAWTLITTGAGGAGPIGSMVMWPTTAVGVAITAVFGAALAFYHMLRNRSSRPDDRPLQLSLKQRIASKLKNWIDAWANRVEVDSPVAAA